MTSVNNFIHTLDSRVWHGMEKIAYDHPHVSRLLAFPIAIGTCIRDILVTPAKCVEEIVLTGKSIKIYRAEQDPKLFFCKRNAIQEHSIRAVKYMIKTPFSLIIGVIDAIVSLVKVGTSPFKTAKINAAKQDFSNFIKQSNCSYNQEKFAKVAWDRFKQQISMAQTNEEVKNLHFLDEEIKREIDVKTKIIEQANVVYVNYYRQLEHGGEAQLDKLKKAWKDFDRKLTNSTTEEASQIVFEPNLN